MKLFVFIVFCCSLIIQANASVSQRYIDSLEQVISTATEDTAVAGAYGDLFTYYINSNPQKAYQYAIAGIAIARRGGLMRSLSGFYHDIGYFFYLQGDYQQSLKNNFEALKIREQIHYSEGEARTLANIGNVYYELNNLDESLNYYLKALGIFTEIASSPEENRSTAGKKGMAYCMNNAGAIFDEQGDFKKALDFYKQSAKIKKEQKDHIGFANSLLNVGVVCKKLGNYFASEQSYSEALRIADSLKNAVLQSTVYIDFGELYLETEKYKPAMDYYTKGLVIAKNIGEKSKIAGAYKGLAEVCEKQGLIKEAYEYLLKYTNFNDSIIEADNREKAIAIQESYRQSGEASRQIVKQVEESANKTLTLLVLLFAFIALAFIVGLLICYRKIKKQKLTIKELFNQLRESNRI